MARLDGVQVTVPGNYQDRTYTSQQVIDTFDRAVSDRTIYLANYATADGKKQTGGAVAIATPSTITGLTGCSNTDVGKLIVVDGGEVWQTGTGSITSGSSVLYKSQATLTIVATGGTFTLRFSGQTTSAIPYNASAGTIQTAFQALSTIGAGNATVTGTGPFTIILGAGASSRDISLLTSQPNSLTTGANGATPSAALTQNVWGYADENLRVHIQGAGPAGGVLVAWLGSFDTLKSTSANLVDAAGLPLTASATVTASYQVLNWTRRTITAAPSATSLTISAPIDAAITADLAGVQIVYGNDQQNAILNALDAAVSQNQAVDLGSGYYVSGGHVDQAVTTNGITMFGKSRMATQLWMLVTDSMADGGRLGILGQSDTARAVNTSLRNFTVHQPCANTRGVGTQSLGPSNKTNASGIFLSKLTKFEVIGVGVDRCFGGAFNLQNVDNGVVAFNYAYRPGGDGYDLNNANSSGFALTPGCHDVEIFGNYVAESGDDMFSTDYYVANGPRHSRINFTGNSGNGLRQIALGRGLNVQGCDHSNASENNFRNTNGEAVDFSSARAKNSGKATITTPGTGAQVDFASAPKNVTVGVTQMRLFNGATDQTWVGDVSAISGAGLTITLTAATTHASVATCPFTGANYLAQWGAVTDGFRFGLGGVRHFILSNTMSDTSNRNTAGDGPANAGIRLTGGNASTERIEHITIDGVDLDQCQMGGILTDAFNWAVGTSNMPDATQAVRYVTIQNYRVNGTGYSTVATNRPWPGVYVKCGSDLTFKNGQVFDTDDQLVLIADTNVGGMITFDDLKGYDIGRTYTNASPLPKAFEPGSGAGHTADYRNISVFAPSGTAGGTQYVWTASGP